MEEDHPRNLIYCAYCSEPIYNGDGTAHLRKGNQVLHSECFFKIFKSENVTIEEDENGDAYYHIETDEDPTESNSVD